jgi:hypothetical protein
LCQSAGCSDDLCHNRWVVCRWQWSHALCSNELTQLWVQRWIEHGSFCYTAHNCHFLGSQLPRVHQLLCTGDNGLTHLRVAQNGVHTVVDRCVRRHSTHGDAATASVTHGEQRATVSIALCNTGAIANETAVSPANATTVTATSNAATVTATSNAAAVTATDTNATAVTATDTNATTVTSNATAGTISTTASAVTDTNATNATFTYTTCTNAVGSGYATASTVCTGICTGCAKPKTAYVTDTKPFHTNIIGNRFTLGGSGAVSSTFSKHCPYKPPDGPSNSITH